MCTLRFLLIWHQLSTLMWYMIRTAYARIIQVLRGGLIKISCKFLKLSIFVGGFYVVILYNQIQIMVEKNLFLFVFFVCWTKSIIKGKFFSYYILIEFTLMILQNSYHLPPTRKFHLWCHLVKFWHMNLLSIHLSLEKFVNLIVAGVLLVSL